MSFKAVNEIWRARQRAAQRAQEDLSQGAHGRHGYDPNQPRVPAGHPDGGQWTSGEHDPAGTARVTVNPDGSMVRSEVNVSDPSIPWDEHHTVRLPNGHEFTFEDFGPTQTVYDGEGVPVTQTVLTSDGPEPQAIVQPAFWRGAVRQGVRRIPQGGVVAESTEAALALFTALSASNSRNSTAALDFRAEDYRRGANAPNMAIRVERLTEEEVNDLCRRYDKTKKALDEAVDKAAEEPYRNAAIFGTRVHKILGDKIKGENEENWRSEVSLEKIIQEDPRMKDDAIIDDLRKRNIQPEGAHYAQLNSIRLDVLDNNAKKNTLCIYDAKTGKAQLTPKRMEEMVRSGLYHFPKTERFIIVEMRPSRMRAHR